MRNDHNQLAHELPAGASPPTNWDLKDCAEKSRLPKQPAFRLWDYRELMVGSFMSISKSSTSSMFSQIFLKAAM